MKNKVQNEFGDSCVRHCYKIAIHSTLNVRRCDTYFSLKIKYKPGSSYKFFFDSRLGQPKIWAVSCRYTIIKVQTILWSALHVKLRLEAIFSCTIKSYLYVNLWWKICIIQLPPPPQLPKPMPSWLTTDPCLYLLENLNKH